MRRQLLTKKPTSAKTCPSPWCLVIAVLRLFNLVGHVFCYFVRHLSSSEKRARAQSKSETKIVCNMPSARMDFYRHYYRLGWLQSVCVCGGVYSQGSFSHDSPIPAHSFVTVMLCLGREHMLLRSGAEQCHRLRMEASGVGR